MFVSNPSTLTHICQSPVYFLDTTLFLCYLYHVLWRFDIYHIVLSRQSGPKSNPIHMIFTNCAPFPSISNPYPFPYGFPLHWRALVYTISSRVNSNSSQFELVKINRVMTQDLHKDSHYNESQTQIQIFIQRPHQCVLNKIQEKARKRNIHKS